MTPYDTLLDGLKSGPPLRWLITGGAGFIGSHLAETLLGAGQTVVIFDNLATGSRRNVEAVAAATGREPEFLEADLTDFDAVHSACAGVDRILHQGAPGSVPRSIDEPLASHAANVTGSLNILEAARLQGVHRVVYASSSSVYGDEPSLPKVEQKTGAVLSPYAATKEMVEVYAGVYGRAYGLGSIGLRYFNVFGPRQDPEGAYAAVIPKWTMSMVRGEPVTVNGDGETSRDFCYVANVVQANLLAAMTENTQALGLAYNVALGARTTLNELHAAIRSELVRLDPSLDVPDPVYADFRPGDIRHSLADITLAEDRLGFRPTHTIGDGLATSVEWYRENLA